VKNNDIGGEMGGIRARLERSARDLLYGSRWFFPLRSGYQFIFSREKRAFRQKICEFYAGFVHRGDLVFDVGANIGMYSEVFSELGANVVAVEPNPACCGRLRQLARTRPVSVECCAVGDVPGRKTMHICEDPHLSTLTDYWRDAVQRSPLHRDARWLGTMEVEVITLDQLAERYGVPAFVKIDVEGYDDLVLRGMSFRPQALSFEYYHEMSEVAARCLGVLARAGGFRFNYARGLDMHMTSETWMRADELLERLEKLAGNNEYGDVFARRDDAKD
jgi:FkbM family methyltransferase